MQKTLPTVTFSEEHISVKKLAKKLGVSCIEMIDELIKNKERGIISEPLSSKSLLPWGAVERTCKEHGLKANHTWKESPKEEITPEDWKLLRLIVTHAAREERNHGERTRAYLEKADPDAAQECEKTHSALAESIEALAAKINMRYKRENPEMGK